MLQLAEIMIYWTALFIISAAVLHKEGKFFRRNSGIKNLCIFSDSLLGANSRKTAMLFVLLFSCCCRIMSGAELVRDAKVASQTCVAVVSRQVECPQLLRKQSIWYFWTEEGASLGPGALTLVHGICILWGAENWQGTSFVELMGLGSN